MGCAAAYLVSQIVVLEVAIPRCNVQVCSLRYQLLYALGKLLRRLIWAFGLWLQEVHITDNSPAGHQLQL